MKLYSVILVKAKPSENKIQTVLFNMTFCQTWEHKKLFMSDFWNFARNQACYHTLQCFDKANEASRQRGNIYASHFNVMRWYHLLCWAAVSPSLPPQLWTHHYLSLPSLVKRRYGKIQGLLKFPLSVNYCFLNWKKNWCLFFQS